MTTGRFCQRPLGVRASKIGALLALCALDLPNACAGDTAPRRLRGDATSFRAASGELSDDNNLTDSTTVTTTFTYTFTSSSTVSYTTSTRSTTTTTTTDDKRPIWNDEILFQPSDAPLYTFYMYRAVSDTVYPPMNVNTANLAGVLWYLHNEVVERSPRKFGITKIIRLKVQTRATQPLWEKGMNFGVRFAFDAGQATGPFECGRDEYGPKLCQGAFNSSFDVGMHNGSVTQAFEWDTYGYFVGCNVLGHFPFPNYKIYYPNAVWYSLPGPCPSRNYTQWDDKCRERQPGGYCDQTPTGQGNCTWTYEDAGEITIDELTDIRNYTSFLESGRQEYMRWADRGKGWTWWDSKRDELANEWRLMLAEELFAKKYPNATPASEIPDPKCDFNMRRFYEDKGYYATECHTAQKGERCYKDVIWAKHDGIWKHPEWYKGLTPSSTFEAHLIRFSDRQMSVKIGSESFRVSGLPLPHEPDRIHVSAAVYLRSAQKGGFGLPKGACQATAQRLGLWLK
eukprot:s179_g12.t2